MGFLGDDRSQAIQVGAVLLFGILIIALAFYQAVVVPDQNERVEFEHSQEVQKQLMDLRSSAVSMPGTTSTRSVTVDLGVRYPPRTIFTNPGPASGTIRTTGTTNDHINFTIDNAVVDNEDIGDFWNGTTQQYNTGGIEYRPGYRLLNTAPTTRYEHSVLYNDFGENRTLSLTDQAIIDGDRLTFVALNGSFSEQRTGSFAVDFKPKSTNTRTIEIESNNNDPITLSIPTQMNRSEWEHVFEDEENVGNITTEAIAGSDFTMLEVPLEDTTYKLELAKVGTGTGTQGTDPAYIMKKGDRERTVTEGTIHSFTVEVRDKFNNPVSGVEVKSDLNVSGTPTPQETNRTGDDGQVTFEYDTSELAMSEGDTENINATFYFGNGTEPKKTQFDLRVVKPADGGDGDPVKGPDVLEAEAPEEVTRGENFTLHTNVSSVGSEDTLRSGTPIQNVSYEVFFENSKHDGNYNSFNPDVSNRTKETNFDVNTTEWDIVEHTINVSAKDASGRVTPGEDTKEVTVSVEADEDDDADQIQLSDSGDSTGAANAKIDFELENTGDSDVDITDISVDETTNENATYVENESGNTFEGAGGFFDGRIDIGEESEPLNETATIGENSQEEFTLGSFRSGPGNPGRDNMNNEEVIITLTFGDGTTAEFTLDTN